MRVSARNVFEGRIGAVKTGAIHSEVELVTPGGNRIIGMVTADSARSLGLQVGTTAAALIKASSVQVMVERDGDQAPGAGGLSARNRLAGTVTRVRRGPIDTQVSIGLPTSGQVHAVVTRDAAQRLGLKSGQQATAVFKASAVVIVVGS
jgi:molybdate transport system regulatory protein